MKTKFVFAAPAMLVILSAVAGFTFLRSSAGFDFLQRIKYPEYYSWKSGKAPFNKEHFWLGFGSDRRRDEAFVGKIFEDIQKEFPGLVPSERPQNSHFMILDDSWWTLQFDDSAHCVRIFFDKG